ncbi:MAG: DUF1573 domain-containing protein [Planctomycetes bacterium]|nr:DUF1573 domain-containing protein [Planctomycetota bacterium]
MRLKGEVFEHRFPVRNDGDATLEIEKITSKCPCSKIQSFPKTLEPGESGEVVMEIDAGKIAVALNEKQINIFSNAFPHRQLYLFYIEVRAPYRMEPEEPVIAGLFREKKSTVVTVRRLSNPIVVAEAKSKQGKFKVRGIEVVRPEHEYRITLDAEGAEKPERVADELVLHLESPDGRDFVTETGITIDHQTPIVCEPSDPIQLLNKDTDPLLAEGAKPVTRRVIIRSVDPKTTFALQSAKIEGKGMEVFSVTHETLEPGRAYAVTISLDRYSDQTYIKGKLILETDAGDPKIVEIMGRFGKRRG